MRKPDDDAIGDAATPGVQTAADPEAAFRRALERDPDDQRALLGLGNLLIEQQRFEEALAPFARLAELRPHWMLPQLKRGNAFAALDRPRDAEHAFRDALELEPPSEWPALGLGALLRRQGRLHEANAVLRLAIERFPRASQAFVQLSRVLDAMGCSDESLAALETAVEIDRDPTAWKALGRALAARGALDAAASAYGEACAIDPDDEQARRLAERLRLQHGLLEGPLREDRSVRDGLLHGAAIEALFAHAAAARARYAPVRGRIVLVSHDLACGGKERQLLASVRALRRALGPELESITLLCRSLDPRKGHDFFLSAFRALPIEIAGLDLDDMPVRLTPEAEALLALFPTGIRRQALALAAELERRRPAVVDSNGTRISDGLAAILAGVPRTVFRDGSLSPEAAARAGDADVKPYLLPSLRALGRLPGFSLATNSQAGVRSWETWLDDPRSRVALLPNIVEPEDATLVSDGDDRTSDASPAPKDGPVVGTALRFSPEKDPRLWVRVAGIVASRLPDCRFWMLGDGPLRAQVEADVRKLGLEQRFTLPGRVSDVHAWLRGMDVLLLTSRVEGAPNVVLEAQALGVPVVSTDVGGVTETLVPGRTGHCIEGAGAGALADRVIAVLSEPGWTERARREAPGFVLRNYAAARHVSRLLPLYGLAAR